MKKLAVNHIEQWATRRNRMKKYIRVPKSTDGVNSDERPDLAQGQNVVLKHKPDKARKVLHAEWHFAKNAWSYVIETNGQHFAGYEPKFTRDQLELVQ